MMYSIFMLAPTSHPPPTHPHPPSLSLSLTASACATGAACAYRTFVLRAVHAPATAAHTAGWACPTAATLFWQSRYRFPAASVAHVPEAATRARGGSPGPVADATLAPSASARRADSASVASSAGCGGGDAPPGAVQSGDAPREGAPAPPPPQADAVDAADREEGDLVRGGGARQASGEVIVCFGVCDWLGTLGGLSAPRQAGHGRLGGRRGGGRCKREGGPRARG